MTDNQPPTEGIEEPVGGKVGRPSKYKPEFARIAETMCRLGATDAELAAAFDVDTTTIWRWQSSHEEFCNALLVGKEPADNRVERGLYQRAVGYSFDTEKIFQFQGQIVRARTWEHAPPDPGAAKLWLCNRRREDWADTSKHEVTGKDGVALIPAEANSRDLARAILDVLRGAQIEGRAESDEPFDDGAEEEIDHEDDIGKGKLATAAFPATGVDVDDLAPVATSSGEHELVVPSNGAVIGYVAEFDKFSVHDAHGRLHGYRRNLAMAREFAASLPGLLPASAPRRVSPAPASAGDDVPVVVPHDARPFPTCHPSRVHLKPPRR